MNKTTTTKNRDEDTHKSTTRFLKRKRSKHDLLRKNKDGMYSALDLGTNNCRLLVAKPNHKGFDVISSFSRVVRLGEGLLDGAYLSKEAMNRAISALRICADRINHFDVLKSRNIATEACRRAENSGFFFSKVDKETGLKFEIITSNEEARLALRSCQTLMNTRIPYAIVFDIGGGSAEIIWAKKRGESYELLDSISLPFGVVTLSEKYKLSRNNQNNYQSMLNDVVLQLPAFEKRNNIRQKILEKSVQMLGSSGTVTTLGAIHLRLNHYDRSLIDGINLTFDELSKVIRNLIALEHQSLTNIPCIGNQRAELILPGCAILQAICDTWQVGSLRVADRGLREGMLLDLMEKDHINVLGNPSMNYQP